MKLLTLFSPVNRPLTKPSPVSALSVVKPAATRLPARAMMLDGVGEACKRFDNDDAAAVTATGFAVAVTSLKSVRRLF